MKILASLLISCFLVCWPFHHCRGQDIQSRFERSIKDAQSISNVEIEFLDTLWVSPKFSRTFQYLYIASGPKYRAAYKLVEGTQTNIMGAYDSAFNGKQYFNFDDNRKYLVLSTNSGVDQGECNLNPLIMPFLFLTKHSDACLPCILRSTDLTSSEFAKGRVLPNGIATNGLVEMSISGLNFWKQPTSWKIAIAQNDDSFSPIRIAWIAPGAKAEFIYKLLSYTNVVGYRFPTRIEWVESVYPPTSPPTILETGMVSVLSVNIPEKIQDSLFNLDGTTNSATVIWDSSQRNFIRSSPRVTEIVGRSHITRVILLLMLFTTVIAPIVLVIAKRFKRRNKLH